MAEHVVQWDEAPQRQIDVGPIGGVWWDLGVAAGTIDLGLRRMRLDPGKRSTPAHVHGAEEEAFFILSGDGLSWQGGEVCEIGPGDVLLHPAEGRPHTLIAGPDGLEVLAFGTRVPVESCWLPRVGVAWLGDKTWTSVGEGGHPFAQEAALGDLDVSRRVGREGRVTNVADIGVSRISRGETGCDLRDLAAGVLRRSRLRYVRHEPGKIGFPPHLHTAEEELFVVLEGEGVLELHECTRPEVFSSHPLRVGSLVARLAGGSLAHAFRGGPRGMTCLVFAGRDTNDISYYPRSRKLVLGDGIVVGRLEPLDFWEGEE